MTDTQLPTIHDVDFATLYKNHFKLSARKGKTAEDWKEKAEKMQRSDFDLQSEYVKQFMAHMKLSPSDTVLDVGCGGGALALAIAPHVKAVYALDFCQEMLDVVQKRAKIMNIKNIHPILRAWEDDWDNVPKCDICISSRSSMVGDLDDAINKLNQHAHKAVHMSMLVEKDFISPEVLRAIDRDSVGFPNYMYALNLLYQKGYFPTVSFIESHGCLVEPKALTADQLIKAVSWSVGKLTEQEIKDLKLYHAAHPDIKSPYNLFRKWALLSWDK